MKIIVSIYIIVAFGLIYTSCDAVCTEQMWINELQQDIAYNGKLDCLRVPLPPPKDRTESEEEKRKRIEAVWDTDCAFEAAYDWLTPLKEKFGLKNGLVDKDGKSVETDFDDQADMCEIARALIAGGILEGVKLDDLNENSFRDLNCPGNEDKIGICAVSGGSAAQDYSWYILLEGRSIQINESPQWELTQKSKEIIEARKLS